MASCYHPDVTFGDPAFPHLEGWRASAMWMMLCERGKDLELEFRDISADDTTGKAFWEARYTFSKTGLKEIADRIQEGRLVGDQHAE